MRACRISCSHSSRRPQLDREGERGGERERERVMGGGGVCVGATGGGGRGDRVGGGVCGGGGWAPWASVGPAAPACPNLGPNCNPPPPPPPLSPFSLCARAHVCVSLATPLAFTQQGRPTRSRFRYQPDPLSFGTDTWACHAGCAAFTHWRISPVDANRIPPEECPERSLSVSC